MKYILISFLVSIFSSCSVKEAAYQTLQMISDNRCESIVYEMDRLECERDGRQDYAQYQEYMKEKQ